MVHVIDLNFLNISKAIASFVIPVKAGVILVETGPSSTLENLKNALRKLGHDPSRVSHVLLTHIHLDHAGAAWWFAQNGASIYLHPKGAAHLEDPSRLLSSAKRIYKDEMDSLWGVMNPISSDRLVTVEDQQTLQIDDLLIKAWHTPGHASHHVAWQIDDVLFTGDVAGVKIGDGPPVPPCPPPDINLEDWKISIDKMLKMPVKKLYLTHFGEVTYKEEHLAGLQEMLDQWSHWVYQRWGQRDEMDRLIQEFRNYFHQQLASEGVDETGIQQYEAANPSWMSISGLLRYWEKKLKNQ